jgi:hypothetical protein
MHAHIEISLLQQVEQSLLQLLITDTLWLSLGEAEVDAALLLEVLVGFCHNLLMIVICSLCAGRRHTQFHARQQRLQTTEMY